MSKDIFSSTTLPTKADKILNALKRERDGKLNNNDFGNRMKGKTEQWQLAVKLFNLHCKRLGFEQNKVVKTVEERQIPIQQSLFDFS